MNKIKEFFKKETVLCISGILALASCFLVPPTAKYAEYIDFRVLILLLCLMLVVAGIRKTGAFTAVCEGILAKFHSIRSVGAVLTALGFFMSMLLTNDVTLVTLVPFTLLLFEKIPDTESSKKFRAEIVLLVLETAAANLGSMLTPMGNPQNLYLYSKFNLSFSEFFRIIFPYSLMSLILILISVFVFLPNLKLEKISGNNSGAIKITGKNRVNLIIFAVLFAVNMLTILRILNAWILLVIIAAAVLIIDRKLFREADYLLLLTFVFFFVFVGNLGALPALSENLAKIFSGREVLLSVILSQVISNVPAAILLSGISDNAAALIIGTDLGGLGTLIASMASLITYKFYAAKKDSLPRKYIMVFTAFNIVYLVLLAVLYLVIN